MSKIIESFKKTTTSKKITAIVTTVWILSIATSFVSLLAFNISTKPVLDYVNPVFMVIVSASFTKSTVENVTTKKLNINHQDNSQG